MTSSSPMRIHLIKNKSKNMVSQTVLSRLKTDLNEEKSNTATREKTCSCETMLIANMKRPHWDSSRDLGEHVGARLAANHVPSTRANRMTKKGKASGTAPPPKTRLKPRQGAYRDTPCC